MCKWAFPIFCLRDLQNYTVNVNIRMYNFDDVQYIVIPSVAYGFVTGMNHQLCLSHGHGEVIDQQYRIETRVSLKYNHKI